jgi:hypothetical protein
VSERKKLPLEVRLMVPEDNSNVTQKCSEAIDDENKIHHEQCKR